MTPELDDTQREQLDLAVTQLAWTWAHQALGPDAPAAGQDLTPAQNRRVYLALLTVLERLRITVDERARQAASAAAGAGADYGDLGTAAGITRQGARRRWPGLAEVTKAARQS